MAKFKQARLTKSMPPTPCTPEMREGLERIAFRDGLSLAEIQRQAFSLFLAQNIGKTDVNTSIADIHNVLEGEKAS